MNRIERITTAKAPRARGYIEWTPRGGTLETISDVMAVLDDYSDQLPLTARQIYYRLVAQTKIGKTERDYKRLTDILVKARRARMIPFEYLRDDGVGNGGTWFGHSSAKAVIASITRNLRHATMDPSSDQPVHQVVLCEAGGMVPQLARVALNFGVTVYSSGRFDSLTAKHNMASTLAEDGRSCVLWHLGDYDPSGVHVYQSLVEDIAALAGGGLDLTTKRLAITPDQIEEHALPMAPAKRTDARVFDGSGTVQAEALRPDVLGALLTSALAEYHDTDIEDAAREIFEAEMDHYRDAIGDLGGGA